MRSAVAIAFLVGLVLIVGCGKPFSGDGVLTDSGFLSYPRYAITFSSLEATNRAWRKYRLAGAPTPRMTFGLKVREPGKSENIVADIRSPSYQGLLLSVEIRKTDGTSLARCQAAVKDWKVSSSPHEVELWHEPLRDVSFDGTSKYEIIIEVTGTNASS